jgi:peptide/nickel transport system substrate-binding protein
MKLAVRTLAAFLLMGSAMGEVAAQEKGGTVEIAIAVEPPTLDPMASSVTTIYTISQHIFETLYSLDSNKKPVPLLAESMPETSADGKVYTIKLRQGVKFHNGKTMTSADVVASLKRWLSNAVRGRNVNAYVEDVTAKDASTIEIKLKQPYSPLLLMLAFPGTTPAVIMPEGTPFPTKQFIGTGPYVMKEHRPDQYIQLVRFDDYSSSPLPADGCSGTKHRYLDEIRFRPVSDVSTRLEGIISGQFHYAPDLPPESLARVKETKSLDLVLLDYGFWSIYMNVGNGLMSNVKLRHAVLAALNMEDMMVAAYGNPALFSLNGAIFEENSPWHTKVAVAGNYNQANAEKAKKLAAEAGYKGEPLRFMTSRMSDPMFNISQIAAEYLKQSGFNIDLQVMDFNTLSQRRANPQAWEMFITNPSHAPHPALITGLSKNFVHKWLNPEKEKLFDEIYASLDDAAQKQKFSELQKIYYADVPYIKVGDFRHPAAKSKKLNGVKPDVYTCYWNAWLSK